VESEVVAVTHLFPPERASLVEPVGSLDAEQWRAPTVCPGWSVRDVALHLLGDDVGLLSRRRDGLLPAGMPAGPPAWEALVAALDPFAAETRVSWVGPDPAPNWLDVAREYSERWTHQQQIRDAVGRPGLQEPVLMARCWPPSCTPCRARTPGWRRRRGRRWRW
jgi:uncharacterized protein (TIGR03083 family)